MDANLKIISNNEELYDSKQVNKKFFDLKEAHLAKNQDDSKSEEEDEEGSDLDLESEKEEDEQINDSKFARLSNKENKEEEIVLVENQVRFRNKTNRKRTNELDSIRFSMYNIQNSQLNEIDAILNELNQLQTEINLPEIEIEEDCIVKMPQLMTQNFYSFNNELNYPMDNNSNNNNNLEGIDQQFDEVLKFLAQTIDGNESNISSSSPSSASLSTTPNSDSNSESKLESNDKNKRNSSDSAFIETVSMPSSVSFSALNQNAQTSSSSISEVSNNGDNSTRHNQNEAQKAELIRIALEKLKEANIKKLIVKAYTDDGCAKSVIIDETMKVYDVLLMLFSKNHVKPSVNYCIVEYMPKFNMERIFEDHENLVEAMTNWSRDSDNQIFFTERTDKYDLFLKPELYLTNDVNVKKLDEFDRNNLVIEFFQNIGSPVPELEGPLYIKTESKKSWKKYYCVLRQSGLYFIPKGKSKKEMQSLFNFDKLDLYFGLDWKKELKSPTDSCFALKYPQVQKKSSKYIKYICCENQRDMKRWINGIRIAKFGKQLYENYKKILDLIEINKTTGRLPVVNNRRLSTNNNNNQRPNSSYSLGSNPQNEDESSIQQTLLIRKESKNDESLFKNNVKNNRTNQIKQPNLAYTDQLKSLIQSKTNFQSNQTGLNSGKSWQNILTPISVTTNLNNQPTYAKSSCCLTSSPNQKTVKIPVTTDLTKQLNHKIADSESNLYYLKNVKIQRNFELEAEVSDKNCRLKINSTSLNLGDFTTENFYDLPLATNDAIQTQENQFVQPTNGKNPTCVNIVQNNVINRNSRGMTAHVAPKPLKRYNSTNESELTKEHRVEFTRKKSIDSISSLNNRNSSQINGSMTSVVDSELSTILARQKKKIEESEGTNKQQKLPSPPITKKPPPPPRNDRMNITRKLSIDNGRYMNLNL